MSSLLYLAALAAGAATNAAVGMNTALDKAFAGHRLLAAFTIQGVGFAALLLVALLGGGLSARPSPGMLAHVPWWAWAGGAIQAVTIFSVFIAAGASGAVLFGALTVTGGTLMAVALDHYGLLGFAQRDASPWRLGGCALLVAGTVLVARG